MPQSRFVIAYEGKARILVPKEALQLVPRRKLEVFYNPVMSLNRDVAIALVRALGRKKLKIADPLAGTGVRAVRFALELEGSVLHIAVNDANKKATELAKRNFSLNKIPKSLVSFTSMDASAFLLEGDGFDYIDIDPFGSPNPFLDAAIKKLSRNGILAITATDVAALAGTAFTACIRKYWAKPLHNELMHEVGLRILARKAQLIGAQYEKALVPIFCHSTAHYLRLYLKASKGKRLVDKSLKNHKLLLYCEGCMNRKMADENIGKCEFCHKEMTVAGPMWDGQLWEAPLAEKMASTTYESAQTQKLLALIAGEAKLSVPTFYSINKICSKMRIKVPKQQRIMEKIYLSGFDVARSHFSPDGLRSNIPIDKLKNLLASL
ncbi:MAG: tRNA (guanine(10)-N(2))-dimethyltransferase [Candidatus Woesearchaeota archaeon]